jgi:hypothetical protein
VFVLKNDNKNLEDSTKYGEFVSSYFAWVPLEEQKKNAKQFEKLTKGKKDDIIT